MDNNINNNNNKIQGPFLDPIWEPTERDNPNANWTVPQIPQKQQLNKKGISLLILETNYKLESICGMLSTFWGAKYLNTIKGDQRQLTMQSRRCWGKYSYLLGQANNIKNFIIRLKYRSCSCCCCCSCCRCCCVVLLGCCLFKNSHEFQGQTRNSNWNSKRFYFLRFFLVRFGFVVFSFFFCRN